MKMSISRKAVKGAHPAVIEYESLKPYLKPLLKRRRNIIRYCFDFNKIILNCY